MIRVEAIINFLLYNLHDCTFHYFQKKTDVQLCSEYTRGIFLGFLWELKYAEPTEN